MTGPQPPNNVYPASACPPADPYGIAIYEQPNFNGACLTYKMEIGMRQRLIPQINLGWEDKVGSIAVGDSAAVTLFPGHSFYCGDQDAATYEYGTDRVDVDYKVGSLIVFPRAARAAIGVWLWHEHSITLPAVYVHDSQAFFPLPEWENQVQASWAFLGGVLNLDKKASAVGLPPAMIHQDSLQVVLYDQRGLNGVPLAIPPGGQWGPSGNDRGGINLGQFNWSDRAASLIVKWVGAPLNFGPGKPLTWPTVRPVTNAPASCGDLNGQWQSSIAGRTYTIIQVGEKFTWSVTTPSETAQGTVSGKNLSAKWSGAWGSGSATGTVTEEDAHGFATRIEWSNGVVFFR